VESPLTSQAIAKLLREFAERTALSGGNPYRSKAYARAADSLATLAVPGCRQPLHRPCCDRDCRR